MLKVARRGGDWGLWIVDYEGQRVRGGEWTDQRTMLRPSLSLLINLGFRETPGPFFRKKYRQ
jgi:hypothetical protein